MPLPAEHDGNFAPYAWAFLHEIIKTAPATGNNRGRPIDDEEAAIAGNFRPIEKAQSGPDVMRFRLWFLVHPPRLRLSAEAVVKSDR